MQCTVQTKLAETGKFPAAWIARATQILEKGTTLIVESGRHYPYGWIVGMLLTHFGSSVTNNRAVTSGHC